MPAAHREAAARRLASSSSRRRATARAGSWTGWPRRRALLAGREAFDEYRERIGGVGHRPGRRGPRPARRGGGLGGRSRPPGRGAGTPAPPGRPAPQVRGRPGGGHGLRPSQAAARLDELENAEARAAQLEAERAAWPKRAGRGRGEGAGRPAPRPRRSFGALVGERLADLAMAGARVEIRVGAEGTGEPIEIALGANVGEAVLPLAKAASGGELARAMLAIRLVAMGGPPTMVFDEVDAGVGGAAALSLGEALHEVSRTRQVLVVTHLAQVAAKADQQITVHKGEVGGPHPHLGLAGRRRGAGGRALPHALGPPRQRRGPGPRPRAPGPARRPTVGVGSVRHIGAPGRLSWKGAPISRRDVRRPRGRREQVHLRHRGRLELPRQGPHRLLTRSTPQMSWPAGHHVQARPLHQRRPRAR